MRKILLGVATSVTMFAVNMAPLLANPTTNLKTGSGVTVNSVAPKSSLIEIEGRTLTDAEAAKVEGEAIPLFVARGLWGAGTNVALTFAQCQARRQSCSAEDYAWAAGTGALGAFIPGPAASNGVRFFKNGQKINGIRVFVR
jgi:hypothetical protein